MAGPRIPGRGKKVGDGAHRLSPSSKKGPAKVGRARASRSRAADLDDLRESIMADFRQEDVEVALDTATLGDLDGDGNTDDDTPNAHIWRRLLRAAQKKGINCK